MRPSPADLPSVVPQSEERLAGLPVTFPLTAGDEVYAMALAMLLVLFILRVFGQMVAAVVAPLWLPTMRQWYSGLMPYRYLLPTQWVFIIIMTAVTIGVATSDGVLGKARPSAGAVMVWLSYVYFAGMVVRFVRRLLQPPEKKDVLIPIVFHIVLAAFLFVYGSWHVRG